MRYYSDGNLAEKLNRQSVPRELPDVYIPQLDEIDPDHGNREKRLVEKNNLRLQYKSLKRWRAKASLRLLSVLLVLVTAVGYIVWRGAKLTEMSFYNAGLKRQIKEIDKENSLLQDKILSKTSLYNLKDIASAELGLQKPGSEQIVHIPATVLMKPLDDEVMNVMTRMPMESIELIESWVRSR
ncbi:MAG: hypothetical protein GX991_02940 [Clostridiaceae bacterium]|jgi:hypothetical protein|nr:hypothetical protein [Clostridiaceae bacterium]